MKRTYKISIATKTTQSLERETWMSKSPAVERTTQDTRKVTKRRKVVIASPEKKTKSETNETCENQHSDKDNSEFERKKLG
jgi:hypothetical protein